MYCLGAALGCDLHRFAGKDSILVFFDTYERVLSGDLLLRIVMYAAGARVGWVIAGRHNLWSGSDQVPDSGVTYGYKDIVYHGHPVDLNTQHFSVDDIMTYFSTLQQSSPSLPALERMAAERVFHATGGLPLAVRIIAEIYIKVPICCYKVELK